MQKVNQNELGVPTPKSGSSFHKSPKADFEPIGADVERAAMLRLSEKR